MALHLQSAGISTCDSVTSFLYGGTAVIQISGPLLALRSGAQDSHCPHVERVEEWRDPSLDPLAPSMHIKIQDERRHFSVSSAPFIPSMFQKTGNTEKTVHLGMNTATQSIHLDLTHVRLQMYKCHLL